jgi:hypothetical protein
MAKSIFVLDRELSMFRVRARRSAGRAPVPPPRTAAPNAPAAQSWRRARQLAMPSSRPYGRSFGAVDFAVQGVPAVPQLSAATCWAASFAMLWGWKHNTTDLTVDRVIGTVGQRWLAKVRAPDAATQGLGSDEAAAFCKDAGLDLLAVNLSIEGMERELRQYGPLLLNQHPVGNPPQWLHARVIIGVKGDGTPAGTKVTLIDPDGPKIIEQTVTQYVREYEDAARLHPGNSDITLAIFRWKSGARAQSALPVRRARGFGAVDARIEGLIDEIQQPSGMTCWATVYTMMESWRRQQSLRIEDALEGVASKWTNKFKANKGLSGAEKDVFLREARLVAVPPRAWPSRNGRGG